MPLSVPLFSTNRRRVLITGFEPFQGGKTNPSWEGVRSMNAARIEKKHNITLFRMEIPVRYDAVDKLVPQMWQWYQPDLTIQVGLNAELQTFMVEKMARKRYCWTLDLKDKNVVNPAGTEDELYTTLNVDTICEKFINHKCCNEQPTLAWPSEDAKSYVCEYTYYTSLSLQNRSATLFVHVPNTIYSTKQLAQGLERILELCLEQLPEQNNDDYTCFQDFIPKDETNDNGYSN
ncbi:hypothetical protein PYW07_010704 [Mythimna separata]|uniref:Pyroglutamyl-peptidase 1 n=1 Tax=Mythimna separata TaxID=271217 RepID=A0AAD7Y7Z3_MYTSE|nr:hypothetical protein PYW07_010704 [Mythimna separata]